MLLLLLFLFSLAGYSDDSDERERILKKYGNKKQYNAVIKSQQDKDITRKLRIIQRKLKEPLIQNKKSFNQLSELEQERFLEQRYRKREELSAYLLKHHHLLEEEDKDIMRARADEKKLMAKRLLSGNNSGQVSEKDFDDINTPKKKGIVIIESNIFSDMLEAKSKRAIVKMLHGNPFSEMSESEVREILLERTNKSRLHQWLKENPRAFDLLVDIVKDKESLPALVSIINKPNKIKKYAIGAIFLLLVTFLLNLKSTDAGFLKRLMLKLAVTFGSLGANVLLFYYLFKEELTPTLNVILRTL